MKKTLFLIFSIFIIISGNSNGSVASKNNVSSATGTLNGHDWVDLGLPSGTKWATCNIGATKSEDYGYYYAWGETFTKSEYGESNYTYSDNPTILPARADAATINWGAVWRMPTMEEINELYNNCTHEWTSQNGANGLLITGPNGNSIFLPAAGYQDEKGGFDADITGAYWSSSYEEVSFVRILNFKSGSYSEYFCPNWWGLPIRPVHN